MPGFHLYSTLLLVMQTTSSCEALAQKMCCLARHRSFSTLFTPIIPEASRSTMFHFGSFGLEDVATNDDALMITAQLSALWQQVTCGMFFSICWSETKSPLEEELQVWLCIFMNKYIYVHICIAQVWSWQVLTISLNDLNTRTYEYIFHNLHHATSQSQLWRKRFWAGWIWHAEWVAFKMTPDWCAAGFFGVASVAVRAKMANETSRKSLKGWVVIRLSHRSI